MSGANRSILRSVGLLVLVGVALTWGGCSKPAQSGARVPSSRAGAANARSTVVHGNYRAGLDSNEPTVTLAIGKKLLGLPVRLPQDVRVGMPAKVIVDRLSADARGRLPLMIRFATGVDLSVLPRSTDIQAVYEADRAAVARGEAAPGDLQLIDIAGQPAILNNGGLQEVGSGSYESSGVVTWSQDGMTYSLEPGRSSLTPRELVPVAEAMIRQ